MAIILWVYQTQVQYHLWIKRLWTFGKYAEAKNQRKGVYGFEGVILNYFEFDHYGLFKLTSGLFLRNHLA